MGWGGQGWWWWGWTRLSMGLGVGGIDQGGWSGLACLRIPCWARI